MHFTEDTEPVRVIVGVERTGAENIQLNIFSGAAGIPYFLFMGQRELLFYCTRYMRTRIMQTRRVIECSEM